MPKETRIALRVTDEKKDRLGRAAKIVGLNETTLVEACVDALIDYIEEHGELTMPLVVVPKNDALRKMPFPSTVVLPSPAPAETSRLNEVAAKPGIAPVPAPISPERITKTRAVLRKIAQSKKP